jgi:6-phosphogluconolactonase
MSRLLITALALAAMTACSGGGFGSAVGPCAFGPCPAPVYTLGGTVSGLVGSGLELQNNGVASNLVIDRAANGNYPNLTEGTVGEGTAPYNVTVRTQPRNPSQACVVANGTGTRNNANVTNIAVTCTTIPGRFLYVANGGSNNISAFLINASSGALTAISGSPFLAGNMPNSVAVEPSGRFAYVANQGDGSVSAFAIDHSSGALTVVSGSPFSAGSAPWSVVVDPTGKFAFVSNAGSSDVSVYAIDAASGALTAVNGSPFAAGSLPYAIAVSN